MCNGSVAMLENLIKMRSVIFGALLCLVQLSLSSPPCEFQPGGCVGPGSYQYQPQAQPNYYQSPHSTSKQVPSSYYRQYQQQQVYTPAPPGKVPKCARPGLTFCEKIEKYPGDLIHTLVTKTQYNFRSLFADESEGFTEKRNAKQGYGPPSFNQGANNFQSGPQFQQQPQQFNTAFNNFTNPQNSQEGYPDRQYQLQEDATHIVEPTLYEAYDVQPSIDLTGYHYSEWWRRAERSSSSAEKKYSSGSKTKRQADNTGGSGGPSSAAGNGLCPTRSQFIMPKAALNSRGEWKYVVNIEQGNEKYKQLVRSETCLTSECSGLCSVPNGYSSRCEQKYVQKRLVALEATGSQLYTDVFWFPHCCLCQITPNIR